MGEAHFRAAVRAEIQGFMEQRLSMDLSRLNMDLRRRMSSPAAIPARSAALTMEEFREASRLAGSPASAAFTAAEAAAFTVVAEVTPEVTGNPVSFIAGNY